jgi:serine/threonine protein kinase
MGSDTTAPPQLGNYEIVSKIADGGMGTVYKAKHRSNGQVVAVKVIAPTTAKNPILLKRFQQEFEAAKLLDHPNVVRALEYHGGGPNPFLVMEFVDGESLGQRMERIGAFPETDAIKIIAQVCEGLQRAHKQGLVHRDVKPDNILVTKDGVAKLTDMGLVKDVEGDLNLTKTGRGLGTPHFMAPEQFRNAKTVDVRGDIYALGATMYAIVTGLIPFENASPLDCWMKKIRNEFPPPKELNPAVSDRIDWAIRRAMSAEPNRRPASCREFLEDITGQSRNTPIRLGEQAGLTQTAPSDIWYMVYKDETGATHTVKGTTEGIRNALANRLLGDAASVLVSRTKTGHFQSLASIPEFRDLVVHPAQAADGARLSGVLAKASGVAPQATERRRPADAETVDLGASPSGTVGVSASRRGQTSTPRSGRYTTAPAVLPEPSETPSPPLVTLTVEHPADSQAQTEPFAEAIDSKVEFPPPAAESAPSPPVLAGPTAPTNWTPFLLGLVIVLSMTVIYLLIKR